jgi:hypothetical protein
VKVICRNSDCRKAVTLTQDGRYRVHRYQHWPESSRLLLEPPVVVRCRLSGQKHDEQLTRSDIDLAILLLNELVVGDPEAAHQLVEFRVPCSDALANHPTIQVAGTGEKPLVGMLGVINGIFGTHMDGRGHIGAVYDDRGKLTHFARTG